MFADSNASAPLSVVAMVTIKGLRPSILNAEQTAEIDFVLVLDKSRSMLGKRMKSMKSLILHFIE